MARALTQPGVHDLSALTWFSIDNDDTLDLDQLSVAEALPGGRTRLMVAVADVDVLVPMGGAVDAHAAANTTSVYTAAGVFPMLPEVLSTDATSLHQGQERLAVVVDMQVDTNGTVATSDVYRAVVLNHAKLTYSGVSAWLDGSAPPLPQFATVPGLEAQIRLHDTLASQLRQWRQQLRLLLALEWLSTPRSVTSIAIDLGYAGTSAFSYMFHQATGCTPSQWRSRRAAG